jgi:hypothetical protein
MGELKPIRVKHMANIGDSISVMAGLKRYYEITGKKIIFCQFVDVPAHYYNGATHPTLDSTGAFVMVNQDMFNMLRPLLLSQEYIHDVEVYNGQPINIDLDVIRKKIFVNLPHQAIQQWIFMAYPDLAADLSVPWIDIGEVDISDCYLQYRSLVTTYLQIDDLFDKIIINFTERYRNHTIDYYFLKKYKNNLIFAGTDKEYQLFCDRWELDIPRLVVNDFLQLAFIIKNAKFLLSNQSFQWNLSSAMRTPHILELCEFAANCQCFFAPKSYGFLHQAGVKYYVELLMGKK